MERRWNNRDGKLEVLVAATSVIVVGAAVYFTNYSTPIQKNASFPSDSKRSTPLPLLQLREGNRVANR